MTNLFVRTCTTTTQQSSLNVGAKVHSDLVRTKAPDSVPIPLSSAWKQLFPVGTVSMCVCVCVKRESVWEHSSRQHSLPQQQQQQRSGLSIPFLNNPPSTHPSLCPPVCLSVCPGTCLLIPLLPSILISPVLPHSHSFKTGCFIRRR